MAVYIQSQSDSQKQYNLVTKCTKEIVEKHNYFRKAKSYPLPLKILLGSIGLNVSLSIFSVILMVFSIIFSSSALLNNFSYYLMIFSFKYYTIANFIFAVIYFLIRNKNGNKTISVHDAVRKLSQSGYKHVEVSQRGIVTFSVERYTNTEGEQSHIVYRRRVLEKRNADKLVHSAELGLYIVSGEFEEYTCSGNSYSDDIPDSLPWKQVAADSGRCVVLPESCMNEETGKYDIGHMLTSGLGMYAEEINSDGAVDFIMNQSFRLPGTNSQKYISQNE